MEQARPSGPNLITNTISEFANSNPSARTLSFFLKRLAIRLSTSIGYINSILGDITAVP